MSSELKIRTDSGMFIKSSDGNIQVGKGAGCITWGLIVCSTLAVIVVGIFMLLQIPRLFDPIAPLPLKPLAGGFGIVGFLIFTTIYLFNKTKIGVVKINSSTKTVEVGKQKILFSEIQDIATQTNPVPMTKGAVAIKFILMLKDGRQVQIGSVSGEPKHIEENGKKILSTLGETILQ